ncbi:hypothetical protein [Rubidibacter lacunae]|uniref:hypothetical protein n=1 Tax=Rubidibacter lacunae TaxID=582514 RepID=UPI00058F1A2F|nr:hypothetical protein [Rubidibacter lacunae]
MLASKAKLEDIGVSQTEKLAIEIAKLLKEVASFSNIVLSAGKLFIVKCTERQGRSRTFVISVTTELQNALEAHPQILLSPMAAIAFLEKQGQLLVPVRVEAASLEHAD